MANKIAKDVKILSELTEEELNEASGGFEVFEVHKVRDVRFMFEGTSKDLSGVTTTGGQGKDVIK